MKYVLITRDTVDGPKVDKLDLRADVTEEEVMRVLDTLMANNKDTKVLKVELVEEVVEPAVSPTICFRVDIKRHPLVVS